MGAGSPPQHLVKVDDCGFSARTHASGTTGVSTSMLAEIDEGRQRVLAIVAGIRAARRLKAAKVRSTLSRVREPSLWSPPPHS